MKHLQAIIVGAVCMVGASPIASAGPARFWISTSPVSPIVADAPTINAPQGKPVSLYIWGQPATDNNGASRILTNISLDIVTLDQSLADEPQPFIDFLDGTYKVYNGPVTNMGPRFQFVADSQTNEAQGGPLLSERSAMQVMGGQPDALKGFVGVSPFASPPAAGVGHANDPNRVSTGNGPAWLIAELSFQSLQSSGSNSLFLQIGHFGMEHAGITNTQVVFGANTSPIYAAGPGFTERETTLPGDTFDVRINAIPFLPGDYNNDGSIGSADYQLWRSSFGTSVIPGAGADGNHNGVVDAADYIFWRKNAGSTTSFPPGDYTQNGAVDAADYVVWRADPARTQAQYDVWRAHFGHTATNGAGTSATAAIPEPATFVMLMMAAVGICLQRRYISQRVPTTR